MSFVSNDALRIFGEALGAERTVWNVAEARTAMAGLGDLDPDRAESVLERLRGLRPGDDTDRATIGALCGLLLRIDEGQEAPPERVAAAHPQSGQDVVAGLPMPAVAAVASAPASAAEDDADEGDGIMECLRCGTTMESLDPDARFKLSGTPGQALAFDLIVCPACGKVEFFLPDQSDEF